MTNKALITEADGKRLAKIAKSQGVCVRVLKGDVEITITPDIPVTHKPETVDVLEECDL